jgi:bidirectional [NiFe] hydrogenase diaphorase subunit
MVVRTDTEALRRSRRMTLELLLAERNHVCAVCVMNGNCELQDLAAVTGVDHVEFDYLFPPGLVVDTSHERFGVDHNRCILCTRCVRVCDEIEGAHTWDVAGRGGAARVVTDMATPWGESVTCTSCSKCVQVCPTGALFYKGSTVGEMVKQTDKMAFLTTARRERRWLLELVAGGEHPESGGADRSRPPAPGTAPTGRGPSPDVPVGRGRPGGEEAHGDG